MADYPWLAILPDAAVVANRDGQIVAANELAAQMFGYGLAVLATMRVDQLIPSERRSLHQDHRARHNADPRTRPMAPGRVLSALRADNTVINVEIALAPAGDGLTVAIVRDISARYQQGQFDAQKSMLDLQSQVIELQRQLMAAGKQ